MEFIEIVTDILECNVDEIEQILSELNQERWSNPGQSSFDYEGDFSQEELDKLNSNEEVFDLFKDFDVYYADFIRFYKIDLLKEEIEWMKFRFLLTALFDYEGALAERMQIRQYKPAKHESVKYKQAMFAAKRRYALAERSDKELWENMIEGGMFNE